MVRPLAMDDAPVLVAPARGPWLVSRRFDLTWIFGGAVVGLLAAAVALNRPGSIVALWWLWMIAFDGPHMMAAYTRTYLDRRAWQERRRLLLGALAAFAVGPICLGIDVAAGGAVAFPLFLGFGTVYGYYHVIRQHYGFLALYKTRAGERSRRVFLVDKWCLYLGCGLPYVAFVATHPRARALAGLAPDAGPPAVLLAALVLVWLTAVATFVAVAWRTRAGESVPPKLWYGAGTMLFHGLVYYAVARLEPVYSASAGPDQDFLLLSIMVVVFHNVQYVALVYVHNRSRYGALDGGHGAAAWAIRSTPRFLLVCLSFSLVYFALARSTGVFPWFHDLQGVMLGPLRANDLALATWWGLALHHYYLDQRIWRIKQDPALREHLGLRAA